MTGISSVSFQKKECEFRGMFHPRFVRGWAGRDGSAGEWSKLHGKYRPDRLHSRNKNPFSLAVELLASPPGRDVLHQQLVSVEEGAQTISFGAHPCKENRRRFSLAFGMVVRSIDSRWSQGIVEWQSKPSHGDDGSGAGVSDEVYKKKRRMFGGIANQDFIKGGRARFSHKSANHSLTIDLGHSAVLPFKTDGGARRATHQAFQKLSFIGPASKKRRESHLQNRCSNQELTPVWFWHGVKSGRMAIAVEAISIETNSPGAGRSNEVQRTKQLGSSCMFQPISVGLLLDSLNRIETS
ncbi:hypothetical protein BDK51DRAFT_26646 [Blyttiomyces helicus]|uniref:Uncharacterized protein n=1 Tax=Blyttiomyces helicus TaxID=388810 RepID=A0A4P9VWJ2_9FUNG|nr:hypothetical protein BDK51DRAFT_26646 [Blyttiomyces helicus]|eukprot:RKO83225.1 hypothetical protein BDK51DRAFT_26646 [Blyttiomyces helicus]